MEEDFGAIFGYNYRRRILINLRNKRKRLREEYLLMEKKKKQEEERKKKEATILHNFFKEEEEKKILLITQEEELLIDDKLQLAEVLKEGLIVLLQELRLIRNIEIRKGIKDGIDTNMLIKEIEEDINNISYIKADNVITPEELGIIKDILYENTIKEKKKKKKKNIGLSLDKTTLTNWIEFDKEVYVYDEFIKGTIDELQEIDKKLDNKLVKDEDAKEVINDSFNKSYKVLMTLAIATKKENPIDRIVSINKGLSLMRDIVNPDIKVKDYNTYSIKGYTKEIERCYMDPSYCRLFILDSKRKTYEISKELKKRRNSKEYSAILKQVNSIIRELDNQELELVNMVKQKDNYKVYIKEMEDNG